jgi:transaldolase
MKIFCDSASVDEIKKYTQDETITGFTSNPTLMKKAGITDYLDFARQAVEASSGKPISFEVFSTEVSEMRRQAKLLSQLGKNVYVKITPNNYDGSSLLELIRELSYDGVQLNVTAVFTLNQVNKICESINPDTPCIISIFSGRIADAGVDPEPIITESKSIAMSRSNKWEILWASPREVFNIIQAERSGADIITATPDILVKRKSFGKDLEKFSLETTRMFIDDAKSAGYEL